MGRQGTRVAAVFGAFREDELMLGRLITSEQVSRSFVYKLELLSENLSFPHEQVLGQPVSVRYTLPTGAIRYFNGLVSDFSFLGTDGRYAHYRAQLESWLCQLKYRSDLQNFSGSDGPTNRQERIQRVSTV